MSHFSAPDNPLTNEKSRASSHAFPLTSGKPWEPARGDRYGVLSDPRRALRHVRAFCARFAMRCETPGAHFVSSEPESVESALHLKCQSSSGWGCCSVDRAITWCARNSVPSLAHKKPWWHILCCMPSPQVVEAGGHPWLHSESEANSGCVRLYLRGRKLFTSLSGGLVWDPSSYRPAMRGRAR